MGTCSREVKDDVRTCHRRAQGFSIANVPYNCGNTLDSQRRDCRRLTDYRCDVVAVFSEPLDELRAYESGGTSDSDSHVTLVASISLRTPLTRVACERMP